MTEQELRHRLQAAFGEPLPAAALAADARRALLVPDERTTQPWARQGLAATIAVLVAVVVTGVLVALSALHSSFVPATSKPSPPPNRTVVSQSFQVPLSQAIADSPEPLLLPTWLPFANPPMRVQEVLNPQGSATVTTLQYNTRDFRSVLISEVHENGTGWWAASGGYSPARVEPGVISGVPALFFGFTSDGTPTAVGWQRPNGHLVTVSATGLSKAELIRVAESLQPVTIVKKTETGGPS